MALRPLHAQAQADLDENGVLDEKEFKALLDTADLNLTDAEKKQVVSLASPRPRRAN